MLLLKKNEKCCCNRQVFCTAIALEEHADGFLVMTGRERSNDQRCRGIGGCLFVHPANLWEAYASRPNGFRLDQKCGVGKFVVVCERGVLRLFTEGAYIILKHLSLLVAVGQKSATENQMARR